MQPFGARLRDLARTQFHWKSHWKSHWRDFGWTQFVLLAAVLAPAALLVLAWGYARAEAQVLVPIEYSGFLWAALLGWLVFAEPVRPATMLGALLVVAGCWIATRRPPR